MLPMPSAGPSKHHAFDHRDLCGTEAVTPSSTETLTGAIGLLVLAYEISQLVLLIHANEISSYNGNAC